MTSLTGFRCQNCQKILFGSIYYFNILHISFIVISYMIPIV
uniref:Uncharacterized protein n=1 Tax=Lepeophtheirus salmonis TaxID=72036 RepID=A0A0K2SVJ2_LEPSM